MNNNNTSKFVIYNASAGSGKTYTLVKSFLLILLKDTSALAFKQLLAITFTNKAVAEMKQRIISSLRDFANQNSHKANGMFFEIASALGISEKELTQRAKNTLQNILQNYTALSISTIDSFNQRLIRNFAFELKLNPEFEVSIDTDSLIRLAVERLQEQIGTNEELTDWLLKFARYKASADKDWNIEHELLQMGKMVTQEVNFTELEKLQEKNIQHFKELRKAIINLKNKRVQAIINATEEFDSFGLNSNYFPRGSVYNFFEKAKKDPTDSKLSDSFVTQYFTKGKNQEFLSESAQKKNTDAVKAIEPYKERIAQLMTLIEEQYYQHALLENALQGVLPLGVLSHLYKTIEEIKQEEGILPIYEFNKVIHNNICNEPTPFIYEKLGQRYKYFFIDEFQDTSSLQWNNFMPLAHEGVSQEGGYLMLVGDAKQAIYRWRGGHAIQFINLYNKEAIPFESIEQEIIKLENNYRSYKEIINFNNNFFSFIAKESKLFNNDMYTHLYEDAYQHFPLSDKQGGYISITFLNEDSLAKNSSLSEMPSSLSIEEESLPASTLELHTQRVKTIIQEETNNGFLYKHICILTRTNNEGSYIANELSKEGFPIISSESLLLKNVAKIRLIMMLLKLSTYQIPPTESKSKAELLLLYEEMRYEQEKANILKQEAQRTQQSPQSFLNYPITDKGKDDFLQATNIYARKIDDTLSTYMSLPLDDFLSDKGLSLSLFYKYSLYDGLCYIIQSLNIADESDAYLAHLLSIALDFTTNRRNSLTDFLRYWEENQHKLSVSIPEGTNAIRVMTIHKSKGLEFPIVIYPLATSKIKVLKEPIWWKVTPQWDLPTDNFPSLLLNNNKTLEQALPDVIKLRSEAPLLDAINVLYVALTRAERHLHIITQMPKEEKTKKSKSSDNSDLSDTSSSIKNLPELFKAYLHFKNKWNNTDEQYSFGTPTSPPREEQSSSTDYLPFKLHQGIPAYNIVTNKGLMWDSTSEKAIEQGNIMHSLLSQVEYTTDIPKVISFAIRIGVVPIELSSSLHKLMIELTSHPLLSAYFTPEYTIYNEVDLINKNGEYQRPDRIAIKDNSAVIIDYKTGNDNPRYTTQLINYKQTLSLMGYSNIRCLLVFIGHKIEVREVL